MVLTHPLTGARGCACFIRLSNTQKRGGRGIGIRRESVIPETGRTVELIITLLLHLSFVIFFRHEESDILLHTHFVSQEYSIIFFFD